MIFKDSLYSIANKVRTKLLLFIDKEIQCQKKNHNPSFSVTNYEEKTQYIVIEQIYTQKKTEFIFSSFESKPKILKIQNSKNTFSTCNDTPTNNKVNSFNKVVNFENKIYSVNKKLRQSSTFLIFEKPKIDKNYLKFVCDSLKLPKKNCINTFKPTRIKNLKKNSNKLNIIVNKRNFSSSFIKNKHYYLNEKCKQTEYVMDNIKNQL